MCSTPGSATMTPWCRWSMSTPSAQAAAPSPVSTRAACSRSARAARARCRDRPATGHGGEEPTVTDALVCLGWFRPETLESSGIAIDPALAERAIRTRIAEPLGLAVEDAALGIYRIACKHMIDAIRLGSISKGYDPGDFVLVAFGGAGAAFVAEIARDLGIPKSVVPPHPGVGAAAGLLSTDIRYEYMASHWADLQGADLSAIAGKCRTMAAEARRETGAGRFCRRGCLRRLRGRLPLHRGRATNSASKRRRTSQTAGRPLSPTRSIGSTSATISGVLPTRRSRLSIFAPSASAGCLPPQHKAGAAGWRKGRVGYRSGRGANRRPQPPCRLPCRRGLDPERRHCLSARRAHARYGSRGTDHR